MTWEEEILSACRRVMIRGGEVHIQFAVRQYKDQEIRVPIVKEYPDNQKVLDEIHIK